MKKKIFKYILLEILRSKFFIGYTGILLLMSTVIAYVGGNSAKAVISILNITLLIVPLVSIIFGTIHFYNSKELIEFLLTQPVNRKQIFWSEFVAISGSLSAAFIIGTGIPLMNNGINETTIYLLLTGIILTWVFTSIAIFVSIMNSEKTKGIGMSIIIWLFFSIIFDGLILMVFYFFRDYPLEKTIITLTSLNPIDLSRILIILQIDISALMGFSGATFRNFFGNTTGKIISGILLLLWIFIPAFLSLRIFKRKNF